MVFVKRNGERDSEMHSAVSCATDGMWSKVLCGVHKLEAHEYEPSTPEQRGLGGRSQIERLQNLLDCG